MNGFVEELAGRTFVVRLGPNAHEHGDAYDWVCVFNVPNGDNVGEFLAYTSKPPTLEAVRLARKLLGDQGFSISWMRMKDSPYLMRETQGLNGEFRMGKTDDNMRNVHAHAHHKGGQMTSGGIDQDKAGETIDAMRALHKARKTKLVFMRTGEYVDDDGTVGFETTLRAVPIAD